jgi:hypothetical protein
VVGNAAPPPAVSRDERRARRARSARRVAVVIWASAVFAGYVGIHKRVHHGASSHLGLGMAASIVGIVGSQLVARHNRRVGSRIQSTTLVALTAGVLTAKASWATGRSAAPTGLPPPGWLRQSAGSQRHH